MQDNLIEISYIETMAEKCAKRRFNKLLNQMHPNRHLRPGDPIHQPTKTTHNSSVADKAISKKRKRKAPSSDHPANNQRENNSASHTDQSDILAPHIAHIIWKHGNHASVDQIVSTFVQTLPDLVNDPKEARRRITKCLSASRKSYRFRRTSTGLTYSATKL